MNMPADNEPRQPQAGPAQLPPNDRRTLQQLRMAADHLKGTIDFLTSPQLGFDPAFIGTPVEQLWDRYCQLQLQIMKLDPEFETLNQGERAQLIAEQREKFSLSEKSIQTYYRWHAMETQEILKNKP